MASGNRMTPRVLVVRFRQQVLELGNEDHGLVAGIARGMMWRVEQPLARHPEVPEPVFLNDPANPFGLGASPGKSLPAARFFPVVRLLVDEEHLENISG